MKKILLSLLAVAALASCSKMNVVYDEPAEIGFSAVAGNITKAVVDGNVMPTELNMYIFAETADNTTADANYINNGEFKYKGAYNSINTESSDNKSVWGGVTPYYWPNVKTLHFAGYTKSGNVSSNATVAYNCTNGKLSITNYSPGTDTGKGANDLMWFPTTELLNAGGYDKKTDYVPVDLYHTCAWITFLVKGDDVTGKNGSTYKINSLTITNIDQTADVECSATASNTTITPNIIWSNNTTQTETYAVPFKTNGGFILSTTEKNVETEDATTTSGNVIVIPQTPGKLTLSYSYTSSVNVSITETVADLDLKVNTNAESNKWLPGVHYIYTITIKANEILVAPTPVDWNPDSNYSVTVE